MTPDAIAAAAARNRGARLSMIERLSPLRDVSREKVKHLRAAQDGAATAQQSLDLMRTLSHVPNFFPTPPAVVRAMLDYAGLEAGQLVLEPSVGKGDLIRAALAAGAVVRGYELNWTLAKHCREQGWSVETQDFLDVVPSPVFDRVLMNPPFERGVDEKHIRHAMRFLKDGGRLVAVACSTTGAKLAEEFEVVPLPSGSFRTAERSTAVNTCLVISY